MLITQLLAQKIIGVLTKYADPKPPAAPLPDRRGSKNGRHKLIEWEVASVRRMHAAGGLKNTQLAELFSVSDTTIRDIVIRHTWKHI